MSEFKVAETIVSPVEITFDEAPEAGISYTHANGSTEWAANEDDAINRCKFLGSMSPDGAKMALKLGMMGIKIKESQQSEQVPLAEDILSQENPFMTAVVFDEGSSQDMLGAASAAPLEVADSHTDTSSDKGSIDRSGGESGEKDTSTTYFEWGAASSYEAAAIVMPVEIETAVRSTEAVGVDNQAEIHPDADSSLLATSSTEDNEIKKSVELQVQETAVVAEAPAVYGTKNESTAKESVLIVTAKEIENSDSEPLGRKDNKEEDVLNGRIPTTVIAPVEVSAVEEFDSSEVRATVEIDDSSLVARAVEVQASEPAEESLPLIKVSSEEAEMAESFTGPELSAFHEEIIRLISREDQIEASEVEEYETEVVAIEALSLEEGQSDVPFTAKEANDLGDTRIESIGVKVDQCAAVEELVVEDLLKVFLDGIDETECIEITIDDIHAEEVKSLVSELAELLPDILQPHNSRDTEKPVISIEVTQKLLQLLQLLGFENPHKVLLEYVSKHDLEFLLQTIRSLSALLKEDNRQEFAALIGYTQAVASKKPLAVRVGGVLLGLTQIQNPSNPLLEAA